MEESTDEESPYLGEHLRDFARQIPIHVSHHDIVLDPVLCAHIPAANAIFASRTDRKLCYIHRSNRIVLFHDFLLTRFKANSRCNQAGLVTNEHSKEQEDLVRGEDDQPDFPPDGLQIVFRVEHAVRSCKSTHSVVKGEAEQGVELTAQGWLQVRPWFHFCDVTPEFNVLFPNAVFDMASKVCKRSEAVVVEPVCEAWKLPQALSKLPFLLCQMLALDIVIQNLSIAIVAKEDVNPHEYLCALSSREPI